MKFIAKRVAVALLISSASLVGFNSLRNELVLRRFTQTQGQRDNISLTSTDPLAAARSRQLDALWQARGKKNIVLQVIPFLADASPLLRVRATRVLGLLEDSKAKSPLQVILKRTKTEEDGYKQGGIPRITLQLALGRINARGFKGRTKVETMIRQAGLSWSDLVRLCSRVNSLPRLERENTSGNEVVEEVVDLLYSMRRKGEDVDVVVRQLYLTVPQKVILHGASLSLDKEVDYILNSFDDTKVFVDSEILTSHLLMIKPYSTNGIVKRMKNIIQNPGNYRNISVQGFGLLFRTVAQMDDPRVLPLLKKFETNPRPWPGIRKQAQIAQRILQVQSNFRPVTPRE